MRFSSWGFLLILILIPLLHRWWVKRNRAPGIRFSLPFPKAVASPNYLKYLFVLKYIGFAFLVVALARPQDSYRQTHRNIDGVDIVLVMDVSASMNIEDLAERSRLDVAKETIQNFVKGRGNDRIGFVVFSGEPFTLAPPTLDYGLVLKAIREAQVGRLKDGTAIGDGLSLAVNRLRDSKAKSKVVILLTDGDNNVGQVDPATAGDLAAGFGIRVYTIAIGREGRVKLPIRTKGVFGKTITTYQWFENALNPELLQHISQLTDGKFYRVTDASTLDSVFTEIDKLERTEIKTAEKVRYEEMFESPLKWGLILLLIEKLLALGWWKLIL